MLKDKEEIDKIPSHLIGSAKIELHASGIFAKDSELTTITGKDAEWVEIEDGVFKNIRSKGLFKDEGGAYYLAAIAWVEEGKPPFIGQVERVTSSQYVTFPFIPKTFYVDVIMGKYGDHIIKQTSQLEEPFKYYKKGEENE